MQKDISLQETLLINQEYNVTISTSQVTKIFGWPLFELSNFSDQFRIE